MPIPPLNAPISWKSTDPDVVALLDDLQANILKGHGRRHTINLFLSFDPAKAASIRAALSQLSGHLKTARQQLLEADQFRAERKDGGTVRCFFLSYQGYQALDIAPPPSGLAFTSGSKERADALGDSATATWDAHFQGTIHALLLLADNDLDRLRAERDSIAASLAAVGVSVMGEEHGDQQFNSRNDGVEHFGYVDGRSQPLLLEEDLQHEALFQGGITMWNPRTALDQVLVTSGDGPETKVGGSFFVFRKLEQNVLRFKRKEEELADALGLHGDDRELAGAMTVGRFEDGTPVVLRNAAGMGGGIANNFNYEKDTEGAKCPFHAHVRKTNPRGSGGFESASDEHRHLMARRGITYGEREEGLADRPEGGVGLLFMSYQSSIENQFEFTQMAWANNPGFPRVSDGAAPPGLDPVIGQGAVTPDTQMCPTNWGDPTSPKVSSGFAGFVTMKGGEYFFAPVISALRSL